MLGKEEGGQGAKRGCDKRGAGCVGLCGGEVPEITGELLRCAVSQHQLQYRGLPDKETEQDQVIEKI